MTSKKIEMLGAKEIEEALRNFGPMLQGKKGYPKNMVRNASRAMANKAKENAESRVPVDTGRLKRAITIKLLSARYRDVVTARGDSAEFYYLGAKKGKTRDDETGAWYAKFVELGTDSRQAKPFLRPAVEEHTAQLNNIFKIKMSGALAKVAAKLAREGYIP